MKLQTCCNSVLRLGFPCATNSNYHHY